jgi:predicted small secreted protein
MKRQRVRQLQRLAPFIMAATLLVILGAGCNTANGFGKDMEKAGEKIQDGTK